MNSFMKKNIETEIVIIGSGLVGLTMAISLAKEGVKVALLDRRSKAEITDNKFDSRASAISYGSKEFLEKYDIWADINKFAGPISDILVLDKESSLSLDFKKELLSSNPMGYIVKNRDIYNSLFKAADKYDNLDLLFSTSYEKIDFCDDHVNVVLSNGSNVISKLLIAGDGKYSNIRDLLSIKIIEKDYKQDAMIFNISHKNHHNEIAIEKFLPAGPFAILPLVGGYESSIVWTEGRERVKDFMSLDRQNFEQEIEKRCDNSIGEVKLISDPVSYPLKLTLAKKYVSHRAALIGDAIHGMHPIAGQGYNVAVRDIRVLLKEILEARYIKCDIGAKEVLDSYQRSRYLDSYSMAGVTHGLNYLFSNDIMPVKLARRAGLAVVNKMNFLKKKIVRYAIYGPSDTGSHL